MAKTKTEKPEDRVARQLYEADKKNQNIILAKRKEMQGLLDDYRDDIEKVLPPNFPVDRLISSAMAYFHRQPELLDCSYSSIISSISTAGRLGLLPDGVLGECYFDVSLGTHGQSYCEFMVGYKGLIALATRSGQVQTIQAKEVYQANKEDGDYLEYEHGLQDVFRHRPSGLHYKPDDVTHFWVKVHLMNGGIIWDVWTRRQVELIRDENQKYKEAKDKSSTLWGRYFVAMACSKLLRFILKTVTLSPDLSRAIALSEMADAGVKQNTAADYIDTFAADTFQDAVYDDLTNQKIDAMANKAEKARKVATGKGAAAVAATEELLKSKKKNDAK